MLAGDGSLVCRRKAIPTVDSLEQVEQAALAETPVGTLLEVVVEPTGPAWLLLRDTLNGDDGDTFAGDGRT